MQIWISLLFVEKSNQSLLFAIPSASFDNITKPKSFSASSIPVFSFYIFFAMASLGYSYFVRSFSLCIPTLFNLFLLCAQVIPDENTIYIPCAILELSGTNPESADKVGLLLCAGTILESYRFLLCAEHIYSLSSVYTITYWLSVRLPYEDILHSLTYAGIR